jgi:hypothetical protein
MTGTTPRDIPSGTQHALTNHTHSNTQPKQHQPTQRKNATPIPTRVHVPGRVSDVPVHSKIVRFGFREALFNTSGFFLNGRELKLQVPLHFSFLIYRLSNHCTSLLSSIGCPITALVFSHLSAVQSLHQSFLIYRLSNHCASLFSSIGCPITALLLAPLFCFCLTRGTIVTQGVSRHQFFPYAGGAMSREAQIADMRLLKQHVNIVRQSHYPQVVGHVC